MNTRLTAPVRPLAFALLVAFACGPWLAGCDPGADARAWVEATEADSQAADAAFEAGELEVAAQRLEAIAARPAPSSVAADDARVVRQDAYERLARVQLELEELDAAQASVDRGIALGDADDVFVANLYTTRGRIHERAGRDREAAADYHRAITILEAALGRALGDEP
jgi:predicted negative regulator of RcsB-dependent stress response